MAQQDVTGGGPIPKKTLSETIKDVVDEGFNSVKSESEKLISDTKNSIETGINQTVGEIKGGIESLRSESDAFKDKLNNTTAEGLISDGIDSLKNQTKSLVQDKVASALTSKLGAKVSIEFDSDGIGNLLPVPASLEADGNDTIASIIKILTGLVGGTTSLGKVITDTAVSSVKGAILDQKGRIGSKASAAEVKAAAKLAIDDQIATINEIPFTEVDQSLNYIATVDPTTGLALTTDTVSRLTSTGPDIKSSIQNEFQNQIDDIDIMVPESIEIEIDEDALLNDIADMTGKDGQVVISSIDRIEETKKNFNAETEKYESLINSKVKFRERGLLEGISIFLFTDAEDLIKEIAPKIPSDNLDKAIDLCQGDAAEFSAAVKIVAEFSDKSYNTIVSVLQKVDTNISNNTKIDLPEQIFSDPFQIGSRNTDFSYISSVEELRAEFSVLNKSIYRMIVHWTETNTNKNIGSEEIDSWQNGIVYNFVIRRDGSIQRGVPLSKTLVSDLGGGKVESNSISVVFVGGINAPTGTPDYEKYLSPASLTRSQINSFDHICRCIYSYYPGVLILGHNDIDDTQIDPGFDVPEYVKAKFGKTRELETTTNIEKVDTGNSVSADAASTSTTTYEVYADEVEDLVTNTINPLLDENNQIVIGDGGD